MKKDIEVCIIQTPTSVRFECTHCEEESNIDFEEFGYTLSELLYDYVEFKCPICDGELVIDYAYLD